MTKPYDIELLDIKTNKVLSGFLVFAESEIDARLKAHLLDPIADDVDMSKYMVLSTCESGKPETKKVYYDRLRDDKTGVELTVCR